MNLDNKQNKGGRPPKSGTTLSKVIRTRVTPSDYLIAKELAKASGKPISTVMREALFNCKVIATLTPEKWAILKDMEGACNNLNQLTKLAHALGMKSVVDRLSGCLNEIDNIIEKAKG